METLQRDQNHDDDSAAKELTGRVVAVDALRGFAILLLITEVPLESIWESLPSWGWVVSVRPFFTHAEWHGYSLRDFGFPGFVMLMGLSLRLSAAKLEHARATKGAVVKKIIVRAALLFALGIFNTGGLAKPWPKVPIAGVLQRLSLCYLFTALIVQFAGPRMRTAIALGLLLGYWALLALVPVPEFGAGDYSPEGNLVKHVDELYLPGRVMRNGWHPEGILGTFPAIATCLFGTIVADILLWTRLGRTEKSLLYVALGWTAVSIAYLWDEYVPINKRMWTPSFALLSVGYGYLSMGVVHQVTEVWGIVRWTGLLVVLGRHPLFAYVVLPLIRLDVVAKRLAGGDVGQLFGSAQPILQALVQMVCGIAVVVWFDRLQGTARRRSGTKRDAASTGPSTT